jgi:hypothetical protein
MPITFLRSLLALYNNLNGGNPRNGFVSQRGETKACFGSEYSVTKTAVRNATSRYYLLPKTPPARTGSGLLTICWEISLTV